MNTELIKRGFDFDRLDPSSVEDEVKRSKRRSVKPADMDITSGLSKEMIIEIIFQKMQQKGGFPSFSKQISDINKILKLKYASAKDIANVIIKDFSLSNKLLKLVNSSFYGQFSQGGISSVEKAMIILGADQVQQAAASLMLFEHMQASSHSKELKNTALKTFMSGMIAKDIAVEKSYKDTEEFLICSMFYKLGENLVAYYFAEKRQIILRLSNNREFSENQAARIVLGITYQDLGIGVGKKWGLPENIIKSMHVKRPLSRSSAAFAGSRIELLGTLAALSNDLCDLCFNAKEANKKAELARTIRNYEGKLGINAEIIGNILSRVSKNIKTHSSQLNIHVDTVDLLSDI